MSATSPTRLTVGVWLVVDGVLDNEVHRLIHDGHDLDASEVVRAQGLRARGWELCRAHPRRGEGPVGWPPRDAAFDLELDVETLRYLVERCAWALSVSERLVAAAPHDQRGAQEEDAARTREALALLRAMAAEAG